MCRRLLLSLVLVTSLSASGAWAEPITIVNYGFEEPPLADGGQDTNWDNIPGWDGGASGGGVENEWYGESEGQQCGFFGDGSSAYQLTDHTISPGDQFLLTFDAIMSWQGTDLYVRLYYDDAGNRITCVEDTIILPGTDTGTWDTFTLSFSTAEVPTSEGHKIGIELGNLSGFSSWLGVDYVRLDYEAGTNEKASNPFPPNEVSDIPRDEVLSWAPGEFADKHDVYLGTNFDDVDDATQTVDPAGVYLGQIDPNSYPDSGAVRLEFGTTYYWRVDEVNAPPDSTIFEGDVWSFTTEPIAYPIDGNNITATASSSDAGKGAENTVNGSGLDDSGLLHGNVGDGTMWLSSNEPNGAWIEYELDKFYKLHEMWVWNSNDSLEAFVGFGFKDVSIEYSVNGTDYTILGTTHEFARAPGTTDYAHNTTVDFSGVAAKYIRLTANSNWGGLFDQYGLSEVRFLYIPLRAREPQPESGTTDVAIDVILGFRAGREAAEHHLHFSSYKQAVIDGNVPVSIVTEAQDGPMSLDLGETYYWKVNEVNMAEPPTMLEGDIWSFSTQEFLVVDDFESYNDIPVGEEGSNPVYLTWPDGFDNPLANGSTIGYVEPFQPSMETVNVHGGDQSVPLFYDNSTASISEVTLTTHVLPFGSDWTIGAPETLVLWFRGDPNNAVTEQMYVKLNGDKVIYEGGADNVTIRRWTQWNIDLASLGVSMSNVTSLSLGFERTGATGGSGIVFIDDIRLYKTAPPELLPVDPGNNGLVVHFKLNEGAGTTFTDLSGYGHDATIDPPNEGLVRWTTDGYEGAALEFTTAFGEPYTFVDAPLTPGLLNIEQATYAFWMKMPPAHQPWGIIFDLIGEQTDYSLESGDVGELYNFVPWFGNIEVQVNDDQWHHVAVTFSNAEDLSVIYVDGIEIARGSSSGSEAITAVRIGGPRAHAQVWASFTGILDEIHIFNRALSEGEILYLSNQ